MDQTNYTLFLRCEGCGEIVLNQRKLEEHYLEDSKYHQKKEEDFIGLPTPEMLQLKATWHEELRQKHILEDAGATEEINDVDTTSSMNLADANIVQIRAIPDQVAWALVPYCNLSESFIREFADRVEWEWVSKYSNLSEAFIREFADRIEWEWVSKYSNLSESFIREFADDVFWIGISIKQKLSEAFIREFVNRVNWKSISVYQTLSEAFIREFADRVDWDRVSHKQTLSLSFIREFKSRLFICENLKKCIQDGHKKQLFMKNDLLPVEISSMIASFV